MSDYQVLVTPITLEPHPNADVIELAKVGEYRSIVRKGDFQDGDLVAYIPEGGVLPESIIRDLGLWDDTQGKGKLAGRRGDRLKAVRLRGQISQGLVYPAREGWDVGQDVTDMLGIKKYIAPIPTSMSGQVYSVGLDKTLRYAIENWKRYPTVLQDGEEVVFTEKVHGTFVQFCVYPFTEERPFLVCSKGTGERGLVFDLGDVNAGNVYVKAAKAYDIEQRVRNVQCTGWKRETDLPICILGEIYGRGVQDLAYGADVTYEDTIGLRVFDVYVGPPGQGEYLSNDDLGLYCTALGLIRVPILYRGPYSNVVKDQYTTGTETVSGQEQHMREGIVMRPVIERRDDLSGLGRVQLKSVSEQYLFRKGGTEHN